MAADASVRENRMSADAAKARGPRSPLVLGALATVALLVFAGFLALGIWQVQRLSWKLDLIARVDQRVHAAPAAPPGPAAWPALSAASDEYRRLRLAGTFLHDRETLVQATTALGAGFWVLTPLQTTEGTVVLVNRGFVPPEKRDPATRSAGQPPGAVEVVGLLRLTEPHGGFLRTNDPAADRWHSRDVQAIADARGLRTLGPVAPYFVDAEAGPAMPAGAPPGVGPVGGLTVIQFPNSHTVYALTWFALALMVAAAAAYVARDEVRVRRRSAGTAGGAGAGAGRG